MSALIGPALLHRLVAARAGLALSEVSQVLDTYEEVVLDLLESGVRVRGVGGGIMVIVTTKPSARRNPQTGRKVKVPAKKKIVFRLPRKR